MFLRFAEYLGLVRANAALDATVIQLMEQNGLKNIEIERLREEREALLDDLRKVFGIKPRTAVQTVPVGEETDSLSRTSGSQQYRMSETPRNKVARLQAEADLKAKQQDQAEVQAALAAFDEDLKRL